MINTLFSIFISSYGHGDDHQAIQALKAKVAWYELNFGQLPADLDFNNPELQKKLLNPEKIVEPIDGLAGEPIEGVVYWNIMGVEKDSGILQLGDNSLNYYGKKTRIEIKQGDWKSIEGTSDQIKIITHRNGVWRFEFEKIKLAGITASDIKKRLS